MRTASAHRRRRRAAPPRRSAPRRFPTREGPRRARPGSRPRRAAAGTRRSPRGVGPSNETSPWRNRTARSQRRSTACASCDTKRIVPPRFLNSATLPKHLRWNCSSPTANTSSSSSTSELDVRCDGEAEAHEHAGRVRAHRQIDELLELGERDDLVHHLAHACPREPVDRAVQIDVLAAGEVLVEARAELEQRGNPAAHLDAPGGRLDDLGDQPEKRRLAGAVPADQPDRLAGLDGQRDVAQRLHLARAGLAARDDHVLERPLRLRIDAERPRDAIDDDAAGSHARTAPIAPRTIEASTATNSVSSFGISIRSSRMPSSPARSCASLSMSQRISR